MYTIKKMEYIKEFRKKIEKLLSRNQKKKKEITRELGISESLFSGMMRGDRRFNETQVINLCKAFNVKPYQLFIEDDSMISRAEHERIIKSMDDIFEPVPQISPIACGHLSNIASEEISEHKAFHKRFLKGLYKPFVTHASGNSMRPTIEENDLLLFNRDPDLRANADPNKIYLLNLNPKGEPELTIKRVRFDRHNWALTIIPDNKEYQISEIGLERNLSVHDYILATAVWIGRELEHNKSSFHRVSG